MPKFNLDINLSDADIAEARKDWAGPLPPKGSYPAVLKVVQMKEINNSPGKWRMAITAILKTGDKYDGCPVFGGVNLTEQGAEYVNQFLNALAKTPAEFKALQKAMETTGPIVDEKKVNVTKIGRVNINSPEGTKEILISLGHNTWQGNTNAKINSFLPPGEITDHEDSVADEEVVEEDVEEDVEDDDSTDEEAGDESMFDDEDEDEDVEE